MIAPQEEAALAVDICKLAQWSFWERGLLSTYLEAGFALGQAQALMTMEDWKMQEELPN